MSVIVLSPEHLNYIVNWTLQIRGSCPVWIPKTGWIRLDEQNNAQAFLDTLLEANLNAYAQRYGANHTSHPAYSFIRKFVPTDAVNLLKLLDCYDYQCADWDSYYSSPTAQSINRIRKAAIQKLPGYDAAPWELP